MSKFVGFIVGAIEIGIGLAVPGMQYLVALGAETILAQAVVDLTAPKAPARDASEMTIALGEQPRVLMVGEAFTPGSLVDGFNYGGKYGTDWEVLVIRLADHKCEGLTGFYVDDVWVPYTGDGNYPQFDSHHFSLWFRSDTSTQPLPDVVIDHGPDWTSADIGRSGCDVVVAYLADKPDAKHPAWPGGRPKFGFVLKGAKCYDPRKDDTVTGGSGAHRWDDPSTWEWSENAAICWYKFERGVYADDDVSDPTKLLVGRGLTADQSPPENVIAAANLCDEIAASARPLFQATTAVSNSGFGFSFGGSWMIVWDGNGYIEWWNIITRTNFGQHGLDGDTGPASGTASNVALATDGTAYFYGTFLVGTNHLFTTSPLNHTVTSGAIGDSSHREPQVCRVFDLPSGRLVYGGVHWGSHGGYYSSETLTDDAQACLDFCRDDSDGVWALFEPIGSSAAFEIRQLVGGSTTYTVTGSVTRGGAGTAYFCYVASERHFFVISDGYWYTIDRDTGSIKASGTQSWTQGDWKTGRLQQAEGSNVSFWANGIVEISLVDGTTLQSLPYTDWSSDTLGSQGCFDPVNHAYLTRNSSGGYHLDWRFLNRHGSYRVAGPIYANQDYIDVELMFAAATAGTIRTHEGAVLLDPGHAETVVATITDSDLVVGSKVSVNNGFLSESDDGWVNTVVPTYIEPDQKWNSHAAPPLRDTDDITADGKPREQQLTLRLVRYLQQAQRCGEIARRMGRLWWRGQVTLGPRFCELEAGDWISWQSDRYFGGGTVTFRIENSNLDEKWQNTLSLRQMLASVFADDAVFDSDLALPIAQVPPPVIGTPDSGDWSLAATTLDSVGLRVPALEVTGAVPDDESAEAIIFEYWLDDGSGDPTTNADSVTWTQFGGRYPPSTTKVDITGLVGGATYYVAVSYVVSGELGERLVLGPATLEDYLTDPLLLMEDGSTPLLMEDGLTPLSLG